MAKAEAEAAKKQKPATYTAIVHFSDGSNAPDAVLILEAVKGGGGQTVDQKANKKIPGQATATGVLFKDVTPGAYTVLVPKIKNPKTGVKEHHKGTGLVAKSGDKLSQDVGLYK